MGTVLMAAPKRLYVRFPDNDFTTTVQAFVKAIAPHILFNDGQWGAITKLEIVRLFNEHAFALYALHQCHRPMAEQQLRDYLQIEVKHVYFDDEIDSFTNHDSDGCLAYIGHDDIEYVVM